MRIQNILSGKQAADMKIVNGIVFNVFNMTFEQRTVIIDNGKIVSFEQLDAKQVIDANGGYIIPGLIDCHMHIESTLLTPKEYAKVALKHGVMTTFADPHEISNVYGTAGLDYILKECQDALIDINVMLPSTVPCLENENNGATIEAKDLSKYYQSAIVQGLSEVMDINRIQVGDIDYITKPNDCVSNGLTSDGHMIGFTNSQIDLVRNLGVANDHEVVSADDMIAKLARGVKVFLREGTAAKDFEHLIPHVTVANSENISLCTDDIEITDMIENGSIDRMIRSGARLGIDIGLLLKLATYNGAKAYGLKSKGAIAPGFDADILIVSNLELFNISERIKGGKIIANSQLESANPGEITCELPNSINIVIDTPLTIEPSSEFAIGISAGSLLTTKQQHRETDDIMVVVNRYGQLQSSASYVSGFDLSNCAIGSTISHDSHNLIIVGSDISYIEQCIELVKQSSGGLFLVTAEKQMCLPLPIGGLLSDLGYAQTKELHEQLLMAVSKHCQFSGDPFLTMAFIALPVIPEIKITDQGVYDFHQSAYIN